MSDRQRKWDLRFLDIALNISKWSKDRSAGTGCVVTRDNRILTTGFNGFPPGVNDDVEERHERPAKYLWTEHCDRNAMFQAARMGIALEGATMYLTGPPCAPCTRGICIVGIVRVAWPKSNVFADDPERAARWAEDFAVASQLAAESKPYEVIFDIIEGEAC
jgi:dCMP deaminase